MLELYYKTKKFLFVITIITLAVSYYISNDYRSVQYTDSATFREPLQTSIDNPEPLTLIEDGYTYTLTPLYEYQINGFVLNELNYNNWYAMYKYDSTFPKDLCITWGGNVKDKYYQDKSVKFSQDARHCWFWYSKKTSMDFKSISNNHLLPKSAAVEKKIRQIKRGDQVAIKGKLINVEARQSGETGKYDPHHFSLKTSTARQDTGDGACEIIYVEDIQILHDGHSTADQVYTASWYILLALVGISIFGFFVIPIDMRRGKSDPGLHLIKY